MTSSVVALYLPDMPNFSPEGENHPATVDRAILTFALSNIRQSVRENNADAQQAAQATSDINRDIAALHEKMILLSLGTIGLSVSSLIAFVSKFPLHGVHKVILVVLASISWVCLLSSASISRYIMTSTILANKKIVVDWSSTAAQANLNLLISDMRQASMVFSGKLEVDGIVRSPREEITHAIDRAEKTLQDDLAKRLRDLNAHISEDASTSTGRLALVALLLMQLALVLLSIAAISLFWSV